MLSAWSSWVHLGAYPAGFPTLLYPTALLATSLTASIGPLQTYTCFMSTQPCDTSGRALADDDSNNTEQQEWLLKML